MTAGSPIPVETFANALESLDTEAFAAFVGEAYAATADTVAVREPWITVMDGDRQTELFAVSAASESVGDVEADAIVVARDSLLGDRVTADDTAVVTPAELRQRLLYAISPAEANAIAERTLGAPMRSATYPETSRANAAEDAASEDTASEDVSGEADSVAAGATSVGDARPGSPASRDTDAPDERNRSWALVTAVVAVTLLAAAVGAVTVGDGLTPGGTDGLIDAEDAEPVDSPPAESDTSPAESDTSDTTDQTDESGSDDSTTVTDGSADATVSADGGDPTNGTADEAARNTAVAPTCERSALSVVQVQMNAFRYNDDATNDGIRAARGFASPTNRRAVGSVDQFISLFETPSYAPMLTYDTAQYSVPRIDNGTAEIEVVTRENGSVTGRYEFRLVRVPGGSAGTSADLGGVDDCWMTSSVGATE